jgi:hypothetical protein
MISTLFRKPRLNAVFARVASPVFHCLREASAINRESPSQPSAGKVRIILPYLYALLISGGSFFVLSLLAFRHFAKFLFFGFDGRFEISFIAQQTEFSPPTLGFGADVIHGLGNMWFAVNPWFIPGYFFALDEPGTFTNFPLAYAWCATELFIATFVLGRLLGVPSLVAAAAAWLAPLLAFQYTGWNLVPTTFRGFPHYATVDAVIVLSASALLFIGRSRLRTSIIIATVCFLGISFIVVVAPTLLILGAPQFFVFGLASLLSAADRRQVLVKIGLMAGVVIACLALGYAHFILGLVTYTAADVFKGLSLRAGGLREVSLLFLNIGWPPTMGDLLQIYRVFVFCGLIGALWSTITGRGLERLGAIAFLSLSSLYIVAGIIHSVHPFWFGPAFWYFEDFLFPYFAIFVVLLLWRLWRFGWLMLRTVDRLRPAIRMIETIATPRLLVIILAVYPWLYVYRAEVRMGSINPTFYEPFPQAETAITRILKDEIGLYPGAPFRGRVVELAGRIFPTTTKMTVARLWDAPYLLALRATGNAHRTEAFSQDKIPSLLEYDQLMTPPYFVFMRRFFTEPGDLQIRNLLGMRHIDPRLLAAVGVRFFVTDRPFDDDRVRLRQMVPVPVVANYLREIGQPSDIRDFTLYLYEVEGANVGQFSPTDIHVAPTANKMLDALADPTLDLSRSLIGSEDLKLSLVSAHLGQFLVERGGYTVRAKSEGRSVLLLPIEFSNCLRVAERRGSSTDVRLIRADLLMTAIIFEKDLDVTIAYHTGPIVGSRCRLRDAEDMVGLEMKNAFSNRPDLQPTNMDVDD